MIAGATTCEPPPSGPNLGSKFGSQLTFQDESGYMAVATGGALKRPAWKPIENDLRFLICLAITFCSLVVALPARAESPAEMISNFRLQHGEGRVTADPVLNRIAHEQAAAMAAQDVLDHSVLGQFSSRMAPSGSRRSAENIAYGYDTFPKTLNQWIDSSEHRKNSAASGRVAGRRRQREKCEDRPDLLVDGDCSRLRTRQAVPSHCEDWRQAQSTGRGSLPIENSKPLSLIMRRTIAPGLNVTSTS